MEQVEEKFQLPSVLSISKFSVARGKEIQILNAALATSTGIKLAFQKLPKHMRRRAMSHNVKRLPRRLREIHMNQMTKSGLPPKQKRPSRKYRRRPYNLISDYLRRQRKIMWLNTHIWHAKRFHMIEKWGYKLPLSPCDRAFKACYRATIKHCLLQDISYYSCLEITGDINTLLKGFENITDPSIDMSISAKSFIVGLRQGSFTLFNFSNKEPIGQVYFIWSPMLVGKRTLWLWLHAAYYNDSLATLKDCFGLHSDCSKNPPHIFKNDKVELKILKYDLSRFRLTGPLANIVLWNTLKTMSSEHISSKTNDWAKSFLENQDENYLNNMREKWNTLQFTSSPAEYPPHIVIPLIAQDPRLNLPKKRTKSVFSYSDRDINNILWKMSLANPIWEEKFRKLSEQNKPSQATLAKMNEKLLVPGSLVEECPTLLPITLIQRPGRRSKDFNGYGAGWDIILPSAWAQPVWLSLIMWGARSGGLREMDSVTFESDQQYCLHPDTNSGKTEEKFLSCKFTEDFFKMPPNKRTNYNKFGISSPLCWNWQLLLKEWDCCEELSSSFFILRNGTILNNLQDLLNRKTSAKTFPDIPDHALVPVSLTFSQKGSCKKLAIICLPRIEDLTSTTVEPLHEDPNEIKRKLLRQEHKDLLKQLKRKRKRARKNGEKIPIQMEVLKTYSQKMRQLWVPETKSIRYSCSREVMGFVKHGDFSFLLAKTKGIGYITINSLKKLLDIQKNKVLVRNTNSRQYRIAVLNIIVE